MTSTDSTAATAAATTAAPATIALRINAQPAHLPAGASVADAITAHRPTPPFAVAVNQQFVPRSGYASHTLQAGDDIEIIAPVTGG